jgi:hypothetical protein
MVRLVLEDEPDWRDDLRILFAFALLALVVVVWLAFVFERLLKIKAQTSETRRLEVEAGDKAH